MGHRVRKVFAYHVYRNAHNVSQVTHNTYVLPHLRASHFATSERLKTINEEV